MGHNGHFFSLTNAHKLKFPKLDFSKKRDKKHNKLITKLFFGGGDAGKKEYLNHDRYRSGIYEQIHGFGATRAGA